MDPLPAGAARHGSRVALGVWFGLALAGAVAVWRLSAYIRSLTALGRTDRAAAAALFQSRVLPAAGLMALISFLAGLMLARQGLVAMRAGRLVEDDGAGLDEVDPDQRGARAVGLLFIVAGALMALLPLAMFAVMVWAVR